MRWGLGDGSLSPMCPLGLRIDSWYLVMNNEIVHDWEIMLHPMACVTCD